MMADYAELERKLLERLHFPTIEELTTAPLSDDYLVLYGGNFTKGKGGRKALTLLDPKTKKYKILSSEEDWISVAVPYPDGRILYVGSFTNDNMNREALTLLDPKTGKYEVLLRENGWIKTAVPYPDGRILYAGSFTKDGVEGYALTLLDPKTGYYEVLSEKGENFAIHSAVPVPRSVYGYLLSE
jgi:hypothetical protein